MMRALDPSGIPRPKFRKNSVTFKEWCEEYNRLIRKATGTRGNGAVAIAARETGLQYNTVFHAAKENRRSDSETALILHEFTGEQVPYLYLVTPLEERGKFKWGKARK